MMQPSCHRIIMRRCCLFLGETCALLNGIDKSLYFRVLLHALSQADAAVALAACKGIYESMESLDMTVRETNLAAFLPVLPGVVEQLMKLLNSLDEEESKTFILHAISVTISASGNASLASSVIAVFSQIWNAARLCPTCQPKCLILATSLINCARDSIVPHVPALCSVIACTVNASDRSTLTTRDFALDTWLAMTRNMTAYTEELHKLFELLVPLIHEDYCDNIKVVCEIVDSYVLLGGTTFASVYSSAVLQGFSRMLPCVKETASLLISQSAHILFVAVPGVVSTESAGAFCAAIASLVARPGHSTHTLAAASHYSVLARYCFVNTHNFIALCQHLGENALELLTDVCAPHITF